MFCNDVQGMVEEFLEGELKFDQEQLLKAHLRECHICQRELSIAEDIAVALKNLPEPQIPEGLYDSISSRYVKRRTRTWKLIRSLFSGLQVIENRTSYAILWLAMALMMATFAFLYKIPLIQPQPQLQPQAQMYKLYSPKEIEEAKQGIKLALGQMQKAFEILSDNVADKSDDSVKPMTEPQPQLPQLHPPTQKPQKYKPEEIEKAKQGIELALGQMQKAFEISSEVVYTEFDKLLKPINLKIKRGGS